MLDRSLTRGRARLPVGCLASVGLVLVVEWTMGRAGVEPLGKVEMAWEFASEATRSAAEGAEILCLGDSLTKLGVQPRVLEARLGVRAYNLAIPGGQAPTAQLLLEKSLEWGARPLVIVVNTDSNLLAVSPSFNREHWGWVAGWREGLRLAWLAGDPTLLARVWLARLPSVRGRSSWRGLIVAGLAGIEGKAQRPDSHLRRNWNANRGAQLCRDEPMVAREPRAGEPRKAWRPHEANETYLRRLFERAAERGTRVVWLIPPASAEWTSHRSGIGVDESLDRWIDGLLGEFPGVTLVDGRSSDYADDCFRDATHLGRRGAIRFSVELAEAIRPLLDGGLVARRIDLVDVGGRESFTELEDVEQSKVALASNGSGGGVVR